MADQIVSWGGFNSKGTSGLGVTGSFQVSSSANSYFVGGGNVGIGTPTPSASLHISGSSGSALLKIDSPAVNNILYVSGSGNVGIGTGTPGSRLSVAGNIDLGANFIGNIVSNQYIHFTGGSGEYRFVNGAGSGWYYTWCQNSGNATPPREVMRLSTGDNLLIGTTSDLARLTIKGSGTTSATTALLVQNANASASFQVKDNSEVVFATPDYTPTDGFNPFSYLSKTRVGIYVAVTGSNTGISYEGGQIYANIGYGLSNPKFTPTGNNQWVTNANFTSQGTIIANNFYLGTNGGYFSAPGSGTDLYAVFAGSTSASGQGRILMYGETHNPKRGKLELYSGTDPVYGVISFSPGNTEAARFTPDGRLNIGAITGSAKVLISGSSNSVLLEIDSPAVNNILYVSGSGNVGIGTGTPRTALDVNGGILANQYFTTGSSASSHYLELVSTTVTNGYVNFRRSGGGNGVTAYYLQNGAGYFSSNINTGETALYAGPGGYYLNFYSNGSAAMALSAAGNLLIGTTSDSARLQVKGSGTTSSTTALLVQNANASSSLSVKDGIGTAGTSKFQVIAGNWTESAPYTATTWRTGSFASVKDIIIGSDGVLNGSSSRLNFLNYYFNQGQGSVTDFSGYLRTSIESYRPGGTGQYSGRGTLVLGVYDTDYDTTLLNSFDVVSVGKYSTTISGSLTVSSILTLTPQDPLPSGVPTGSFAVSSSAPPKPYFYDGTTWNALY